MNIIKCDEKNSEIQYIGYYKMLEKMTRHNGYENISEFLDIWVQAFNIEKL